jgi:hypothetical protein
MAFTPLDNFRANLLDLAQAVGHIIDNGGSVQDWEIIDEYLDNHGNVTISLSDGHLPDTDPREFNDTV